REYSVRVLAQVFGGEHSRARIAEERSGLEAHAQSLADHLVRVEYPVLLQQSQGAGRILLVEQRMRGVVEEALRGGCEGLDGRAAHGGCGSGGIVVIVEWDAVLRARDGRWIGR